jgi:hypothetical protein
MRMGLILSFIGMLGISLSSCQKSKSEESVGEEAAVNAGTETETANADQATESAEPVSCRSLNIPTYDLVMKDLSALRCDNCHNETFAWQGIVLTQYDAWKTYVKPIRNRIFYNLLSQPLEPGEQELFLTWIDKGLPRTDADCGNLK